MIHSFWVPALAGKTDLIPGQTNTMWIEADSAGRFTDVCGVLRLAHANMRIVVLVEAAAACPLANRQRSRRGRPGQPFFERGCAACHTIRGPAAAGMPVPTSRMWRDGRPSPPASFPTRRALARWLSAPDPIKPGALMPRPDSRQETRTYRYLRGLQ